MIDADPSLSPVPQEHVIKVEDAQEAVALNFVGMWTDYAGEEAEAADSHVSPGFFFPGFGCLTDRRGNFPCEERRLQSTDRFRQGGTDKVN